MLDVQQFIHYIEYVELNVFFERYALNSNMVELSSTESKCVLILAEFRSANILYIEDIKLTLHLNHSLHSMLEHYCMWYFIPTINFIRIFLPISRFLSSLFEAKLKEKYFSVSFFLFLCIFRKKVCRIATHKRF